MKYNIGDLVRDEDGCEGIICIRYEDGDICANENDAAHPNPVVKGRWTFAKQRTGQWWFSNKKKRVKK